MLLVNCLEAWKLGSQEAEVSGILKYLIDESLLSFQPPCFPAYFITFSQNSSNPAIA